MTEQTLTLIAHNPSFNHLVSIIKPNFRSQDAIISKVSIIVTFSHIKGEVAKIKLAVKYVKLNTGLSNKLESLMLHTKYMYHRNRPTGSWKQSFLVVIPHMGSEAILVV